MKIWPERKEQLKKITLLSLFLYLAALLLLTIRSVKFLKFISLPQPTIISQIQPERGVSPCPQRIDESGWTLKGGQVRTFPRCLTVMNSRLGSRLNFDWHFSQQKVTSSVLGNQEDKNLFLTLKIKNKNQIEQIFPVTSNPPFPHQSVDLGLNFQKINFENDQFLVSLKINSPFTPSKSVKDENAKISNAPFFYLDLTVLNKTVSTQAKTLIFALSHPQEIKKQAGLKVISFADQIRKDGYRALAAPQNQSLTPFIEKNQGGFYWEVTLEPHSSLTTTFVYAGFLKDGVITDNSQTPPRALKFAYTQWFVNIEEVIKFAFEEQNKIRQKSASFETILNQNNLSPQVRWLLAQAFHSYLGNTFLVYDEKEPERFEYFVWEGEFKYLNTLDVAHDYAVLEGKFFPWALKFSLQSWQKSAKKDKFGTVIPHDTGLRFNFTASQAYAIEGHETSGMPVEENANFILLSYWYWQQTDDDQLIKSLSPLIKELIESLIKRDGNQNGIADQRIGMTTYDNDGNLALKKAPDSTYLGIKQLAAYLAAEEIFQNIGQKETKDSISEQAKLITQSLKAAYQTYGFIPLTLDPHFKEEDRFDGQPIKGTEEQGFAFIVGLFYPSLSKLNSPLLDELIPILSESYQKAYQKCLVKDKDENIIGLKLAQNQSLGLGWFSHSAIADYIAKGLFNQEHDSTTIYFPLLYDSHLGLSDGQYFKEPFFPPQVSLNFYPRGAALFAFVE